MIPNISNLLPYDQRLTEVGLWSLEADRRLRADLIELIEVYKIIHGLYVICQFSLIFRILSPRSNNRTHPETSQT